MPIYEYVCPDCDLKFELLRPLNQATDKVSCTRCQHPAQRRLSTFASFSRNEAGESIPIAGRGSSCAGCSATGCSTCGL